MVILLKKKPLLPCVIILENKGNTMREKLKEGSVISYGNHDGAMEATVILDEGNNEIIVDCEGHLQIWKWFFEGCECEIVKKL